MNYPHELRQAKELLDKGLYNLCSVQCGRILEELLKSILSELSVHCNKFKPDVKIKFLLKNDLVKTSKKTLGSLTGLVQRPNTIALISRFYNLNRRASLNNKI